MSGEKIVLYGLPDKKSGLKELIKFWFHPEPKKVIIQNITF